MNKFLNCEVWLCVHTESFICDFLFVSVEILKYKICIYQITGVSLFLDFVSFFSVFLQQQIARDAHRLVSTYSITSRNMLLSCRCHFEINRKPAQSDKFSGHISLSVILMSARIPVLFETLQRKDISEQGISQHRIWLSCGTKLNSNKNAKSYLTLTPDNLSAT